MPKLKKYLVKIESLCRTTVEVEAESGEEASELVKTGEYEKVVSTDCDDTEVVGCEELTEEDEEAQRLKDEKNGVYPGKWDIAN